MIRWTLIVPLGSSGQVAGLYNGTVYWGNVQVHAGAVMLPGPVLVQQPRTWVLRLPRHADFFWLPRWSNWQIGKLLAVPLWIPLVCVLVPRVVSRAKRSRRIGAGICSACGYDLKGLGGSSNCPECGTDLPTDA